MPKIKRICVYCGSSDAVAAKYLSAAKALGTEIAKRGYGLVYGGGATGLMGAVADAVLALSGEVIGVIPQRFYTPKLAHHDLSRLEIVPDMHSRKARMAEIADAFIALPGGYGTMEEFFEIITWAQIGLHDKPIGLYNFQGYYDPILNFIGQAVDEGFIFTEHRGLFVAADSPKAMLDALEAYQHPGGVQRWLRED